LLKKLNKKEPLKISTYLLDVTNPRELKNTFTNYVIKKHQPLFLNNDQSRHSQNTFLTKFSFYDLFFLFFKTPMFFKLSILTNPFNLIKSLNLGTSGIFFYFFNNNLMFYSKRAVNNSNLIPKNGLIFIIQKKLLETSIYYKFPIDSTPYYCTTLIDFLTYCSGRKVALYFTPFINNYLNTIENSHCIL